MDTEDIAVLFHHANKVVKVLLIHLFFEKAALLHVEDKVSFNFL